MVLLALQTLFMDTVLIVTLSFAINLTKRLVSVPIWKREAGIVQWLEHQTHDRKVLGSSPRRSSRRNFFSRVNFLYWLLFWYLFHPCVTAAAPKRSWSFCQKCRLQLNTRAPYLCGFECSDTVNWCMAEWCTQNLHWDGSTFTWHQSCKNRKPLLVHHFNRY